MNETPNDQIRTRRMNTYLVVGGICMVAILVIGGPSYAGLLIPFAALFGVFAAGNLIYRYFNSNRYHIPDDRVTQEIVWLYGPARLEWAGAKERSVAEGRIRQRQISRGQFFVVFIPLWLVGAGIIFALGTLFRAYSEPGAVIFYLITAWFVVLLLFRAIKAFPTTKMLEKRERLFANPLPASSRTFPFWGWLFIAACLLIPIITLGGLLSAIIGIAGAGICYLIAREESHDRNLRIALCIVTTVAAWALLVYLVRSIIASRGF